jgi:hypothetical protein
VNHKKPVSLRYTQREPAVGSWQRPANVFIGGEGGEWGICPNVAKYGPVIDAEHFAD